jgi:hypothetical protein
VLAGDFVRRMHLDANLGSRMRFVESEHHDSNREIAIRETWLQ